MATTNTTTTQYPDDFKCPISLEIMSEPVILSSGHTFDRPSIQRWLDAGHRTCPITKLPLSDTPSLIPNHALRSLISTYTASSVANAALTLSKPHHIREHPETLISNLTSKSSSPEVKLVSIEHLCQLSKRDFELRKRLTESGAVAALLGCVSLKNCVNLQEKSLKLLLNLSLDDDNKVGLVAEGAICHIIAALCDGESADCRATAATVLTSLAVVEVNKATIGAYPFAIRGLVKLLNNGVGRERKEAATALYALCSFPDNRRRAVECGAVEILVNSLDSGLERAVEVLGLLAKCKRGREEMVRFNGCVKILIHVVRNGSSRGVQYALLTLTSLCLSSEVICMEALKEGVFELCLRFLEDDNEKVRRNASSLIKVFGGAGCI
ncbi:U-box domain-containing protein 8 [Cynara cardunculus var. scolymus]|uniref:RING-type E3 ubiquitin transferase n=1 Tax=Cynara cardunculus var. scolymus TaxID=59895 RepID=A0A103XF39_CYNCS|nr:U-box domain-containing protein 8 [Cynara cardunculus var. scolymus]KVH89599.1 Armadillo [Cynara cardunculus var. scolymus]